MSEGFIKKRPKIKYLYGHPPRCHALTYEDFILDGYEPHPHITLPTSPRDMSITKERNVAFSPAVCGDPAHRAHEGFCLLDAKDSFRSG